MAKSINNYRVELEDGSSNTFLAESKTEARQLMNDYLRNICGFGGRYGAKLPKIVRIEVCSSIFLN
jgi:hypothetical protein